MNGLFFQWFCLETEGKTCEKNNVTLSEAALKSTIAIPWELPEIYLKKLSAVLGKFPETSLLFHGKAISLSFVACGNPG